MDLASAVDEQGFAIVERVTDDHTLRAFRAALDARDPTAGLRGVLEVVPGARAFVDHVGLERVVAGLVGARARIVRATLFDKSRGANWRVPWHQDLFVAVKQRVDVEGFSAWTSKDGVPHARAPRQVLERMIAVRIHIDDCTTDNGPLRVLPATHKRGVMTALDIEAAIASVAPSICTVPAGGALVMRPLLLHSSSSATSPQRRRVLHLDIADFDLPAPLAWWSPATL